MRYHQEIYEKQRPRGELEGWDGLLSTPSHKSRDPLLLDRLQHETSREQLHKQSRPETASDYNVDKTTGVPSSRFEKTQTINS